MANQGYSPLSVNSEDVIRSRSICFSTISDIFSIEVLQSLGRDAVQLITCKVLRMFSFGFLAVMLVIYLSELRFSPTQIGLMFTLTLLGDAFISILLTSHADRFGRKLSLIFGSLLAVVTSIVFSFSENFWVLLISAIIGVISPSGNEIGPFMAIEISSLSQVTRDSDRTKVMAWYNLFGCFASASGALVCGFALKFMTDPTHSSINFSMLYACRIIMVFYSILQVCQTVLFSTLGENIEVHVHRGVAAVTTPVGHFMGLHKSKYIVLQLSALFIIDSFAGSFILQSIISNWFFDTYHTSADKIGMMSI